MKDRNARRAMAASVLFLGAGLLLPFGCSGRNASVGSGPDAGDHSEAPAKGGAQMWAENCARCHNTLSPSTYSDAQWDVIVHHMRVRGNLTAEEHETIARFLKAGN